MIIYTYRARTKRNILREDRKKKTKKPKPKTINEFIQIIIIIIYYNVVNNEDILCV